MKTINKVTIGAACVTVFLSGLVVFGVSLKLETKPETASAATVTCSQVTSPIKDIPGLTSITIVEKTGINNTLTYNPTNSSLNVGTNDLNTTASEHYDFYYSDADGAPNVNGAYISSRMHRDISMANAQSGNNIDSMKLSLSSGTYYADLVASYQLGASVSSVANAALPKALGAPDGVVSTVGDQDSRITLGFCAVFPVVTQCSDGIDNDNDQATDLNDFSCASATDDDETFPKSKCQDGLDNDSDNLTDYPQDPGCSSKQDNDEFNAVIVCRNDNDCPADSFTGNLTCQGNDVYQNYRNNFCVNPNTTSSYCDHDDDMQLKQMCAAAQACDTGGCFPETW